MSKLVELRERMTTRLAELKALAEKDQRDAAEEERVDALLLEVNELGPAIDKQLAVDAALAQQRAYTEPAGSPAARLVPIGADDPETRDRVARDLRSFGRRFTASEEYKRALAHPKGLSKDAPFHAGSFFHRDRDAGPEEQRALVYSATPAASFLLPQVLPTIYRGMEADLVLRDVLIAGRTSSDAVTVLQENVFTNAAAEVAEAVSVATGAKPESAITFTEATFPVKTIAHWIPITRQVIQDLPMMETYVNDRLLIGLARREDSQFLNGDGAGANLTGILNTSGIQDLNAAYFAANPVKNAGTDNENINRIRRAKTKIQVTGKARATFLVANPTDVEEWETTADADRRYLFGGPGTGFPRTMWGLPLVESEGIAENTVLVGDGTMAAVMDRMDATIYTTDSHSDFFIRNILVILAEERVALPIFRVLAFAKVALVA